MPIGSAVSNAAPCARPSCGEKAQPETLLEPFDPPTLEELEASVEWEEMPVVDTYELYKEHLAQKEQLVSVEEALAMRNDSPEANEKIISALGRPPESDGDVDWNSTMSLLRSHR